jgi:hypothetical protein
MKVTALLCDFAQVADGKLFISGAGWNITGPGPAPSAVALLFEVPWDMANTKIKFKIELLTTDEHPVTQPGPLGEVPIKAEGELEVGRPAGIKAGSELNAPFAFVVPPLALEPDSRYQWVITVAGGTPPVTRLPFMTRPAQ